MEEQAVEEQEEAGEQEAAEQEQGPGRGAVALVVVQERLAAHCGSLGVLAAGQEAEAEEQGEQGLVVGQVAVGDLAAELGVAVPGEEVSVEQAKPEPEPEKGLVAVRAVVVSVEEVLAEGVDREEEVADLVDLVGEGPARPEDG